MEQHDNPPSINRYKAFVNVHIPGVKAHLSFLDPTHLLPLVFGTATWHPAQTALPWLPKLSGLWRFDFPATRFLVAPILKRLC